jgi:hypothetical protein
MSAMMSAASSIPSDRRTKPSGDADLRAPLRRHRRVRRVARLGHQRLHAAQAGRERRQLQRAHEPRRGGTAAAQLHSHHPAEAVQHLRGERVVRVRGQARIVDARHLRPRLEPRGHLGTVAVVALHAHGQRLHAALQQPGGVRVQRRPPHPRPLARRRDPRRAPRHIPGRDVAVAAQVFGGAVHHHVGAVRQRPKVQRRGEGAVRHHRRAVPVRRLSHGGQVGDAHQRVGRRLRVHQPGVGAAAPPSTRGRKCRRRWSDPQPRSSGPAAPACRRTARRGTPTWSPASAQREEARRRSRPSRSPPLARRRRPPARRCARSSASVVRVVAVAGVEHLPAPPGR